MIGGGTTEDKYTETVIGDCEKYQKKAFERADTRNYAGKPYACYVCLRPIRGKHILIEELTSDSGGSIEFRRYHRLCIGWVSRKFRLINLICSHQLIPHNIMSMTLFHHSF